MYAARLLYPVEVLGPGKRIGIWLCGCPRRCRGCSNPELWIQEEKYRTSPEKVYSLVCRIFEKYHVDGFTISGGDPFYQYDDLRRLLDLISPLSRDVLVYTGYTYEEIKDLDLTGIGVLIDGEYIEERNNNTPLRGSDNQRIIILDDELKPLYEEYLKTAVNRIQNFPSGNLYVSVGIHRPDFKKELEKRLPAYGLMEKETPND